MKQGRASRDVGEGRMHSPYSSAVNVKGVSQIGSSLGNHITERTFTVNPIEPLHKGRGFQAPQPKTRQYHCGSQGKR